MKWKKPQLPMITFLIIFKIQLYFVHSFSRNKSPEKCKLNGSNSKKLKGRVVTRYMRSGITAPGSGITTLGIGISSVFVESGIKIVNVFGIRDQNSQCFCDQGLKFSTFLWSGIKIWGKNTGSVKKKNTLLRPCKGPYAELIFSVETIHVLKKTKVSR